MTLPIFPSSYPGLAFDVLRTPLASTRVMTARSGKEYRAQNWSYGKYRYGLTYSVLRAMTGTQEFQSLVGFINSMGGMYGNFLYDDPTDDTATLQQIGVGDGATKAFSFVRAFGGFVEPVTAVNAVSQVKVNGTITAAYTLSQTGLYGTDTITFTSAPAAAAPILATFSFYWPCRFLQDDPEFNNLAYQLWALKKLEFQTVK